MPDQLLPQPPPNAPAPPPSEEALRSRRKMGWVIRAGVWSIILLLVYGLTPPLGKGCRKSAVVTEAISNARQIGLALSKFESEHGKYPDNSTAAALRQETDTIFTLPGLTSNDIFAQLLVYGIMDDERLFFAEAKSMRRPDNVFNADATILEHGECAFAYISDLSSTDDPSTPILFGPVIPGTTTLDRMSCEGKAVVLRLDNSVTALPINSAGKIILNGLDLLDPLQPFWNGKAPDVKWPK